MTAITSTQRLVRTQDTLLITKDVTAAVTTTAADQVGGVDKVIDCGGVGMVDADLVVDITAVAVAAVDEIFFIDVEGSNSPTFANTVVKLARLVVGNATATGESLSSTVGRYLMPFQNQKAGTMYQYLRTKHTVAGTTHTITYSAYIAKDDL